MEDRNRDLHDRLIDEEVWDVDGGAEEEEAGEDDGGGPGGRLASYPDHLLENRLLRTTRANRSAVMATITQMLKTRKKKKTG